MLREGITEMEFWDRIDRLGRFKEKWEKSVIPTATIFLRLGLLISLVFLVAGILVRSERFMGDWVMDNRLMRASLEVMGILLAIRWLIKRKVLAWCQSLDQRLRRNKGTLFYPSEFKRVVRESRRY